MGAHLKSICQSLLKRAGLYERAKNSWVYDAYWRIADRRWVDERRCEKEFYRHTLAGLRKNDLIFDIGANRGLKTGIFLSLGARVVAVDPDIANQNALKERFLAYRLRKKPVVVVGKAVSDQNGHETFLVSEPGFEMNTLSSKWADRLEKDPSRFGRTHAFAEKRKVETTTLEDLISTYGRPFYIKIDVEGYEAKALKGLQTPVRYISFEVNLPEFAPEAEQCMHLLGALSPLAEFNYAVGCQGGLALEAWLPAVEFMPRFQALSDSSIEVFWRSAGASSPPRG